MKKIMLIGLGPHAKRIYVNYFKKHNIIPTILLELESEYEFAREYLDANGFEKTKIWLLPDKYKDNKTLPKKYYNDLKALCKEKKITHIISSSEPKAHNMYLKFALENNINILTDKPITVRKKMTKLKNINSIKKDYYKLLKIYNNCNCQCKIMCQRNYHKGYTYVRNLLKDVVSKYNIPITYIDIYHCDGNWEMIHDLDKENHPYKYGYGKLFHSGYHFIDLLAELIKINNNNIVNDKKVNKGILYGNIFTPNDEFTVFNKNDYKKIFKVRDLNIYKNYERKKFKNYGEKNFYSQLNFYNKDNKLITTANLNLLHYGFSRRGWFESRDYYKNNGRVRHERINIQVGTLLNIQIHSYQSKEIKDRNNNIDEINVGGLEHFDIDIYRNVDIIGGKPFERISLYDICGKDIVDEGFLGYNEKFREDLLNGFLNDNNNISDLNNHKLGIEILYNASKVALNKRFNRNKVFKFRIPKE